MIEFRENRDMPREDIQKVREFIYTTDESTLRERESEFTRGLMFMLGGGISQNARDKFLLNNREHDTHLSKTKRRLEKLDIYNLEQMAEEFKVKFTSLDMTFKMSTDALQWLQSGDRCDENSQSFDAYEKNYLNPCNRRWAFLGEMEDLAHYFAIRASNRHVFRRRIKDYDYIVTVTEDVPPITISYLKALVDLPTEEEYQKVATTFIMGFTV